MDTQLVRFTQWAEQHPQARYNALMGLLSQPEGLLHSFEAQPGNKARGIDAVGKADYAEGVERRIAALSTKLRSLSYRPQPVRRVYIAKSNGRQRPLGIPCFEDRIVQHRLAGVLQAIWEPEFRHCSYGFRPQRNAHQALARVGEVITNRGTQWLVEADIKGFFDHVSHDWLMRFLAHRINDPVLLAAVGAQQVPGTAILRKKLSAHRMCSKKPARMSSCSRADYVHRAECVTVERAVTTAHSQPVDIVEL